jgi:hypothetical protein
MLLIHPLNTEKQHITADVILNIKLVKEGDGGVTLLQSHYVKKVLSRFDYSDLNPLQHLMMLV